MDSRAQVDLFHFVLMKKKTSFAGATWNYPSQIFTEFCFRQSISTEIQASDKRGLHTLNFE